MSAILSSDTPLKGFISERAASLSDIFYRQRSQLILWIPVIFACGIGAYFSLRFEPAFIVSACLGVFTILLCLLTYHWRERSAVSYALWLMLAAASLFIGGFTCAQYRTMTLNTIMINKDTGPVNITGNIIDIDRMEEGAGSRIILNKLEIERHEPEQTPQKVRLRVKKDQDLRIGQRITVLGTINPPSAPVSPDAFDFQHYAYYQGLGGFGFAFKQPTILSDRAPDQGHNVLEAIRQHILGIIDNHISTDSKGVAAALITGERTQIPQTVWDDMRDSGMAHMLAISGLHVGMVAGVVFFFVRLVLVLIPNFAERRPIKKYAAVTAIIGAFLYMLIVGSTIPTQRAMLMTTIIMLAVILDRKAFSMRLVAITAFLVLLITPEALLSASFQMSFSAVTLLVYFYDNIRNLWSDMHRNAGVLRRLGLYIMGVSMTTVVATLATAPFAIYHFQQLSVYSLFANLVGVPIMAFIVMPLTAFSYLSFIFGMEAPVLWGMQYGIGIILDIAHYVAHLDGATWNPPAWNAAALLMLVMAVCLWILLRGKLRALAILPLLACIIFTLSHKSPDILISASGKLIAYRDEQGTMHFNSRSSDRFSSDIWARRNGQDDKPKWPYEHKSGDAMQCDSFGCHLEQGGYKIAFSRSPQSHNEDCAWADIMVAEDPVFIKPCNAKTVIDKFYLWRNGAASLRLDEKAVMIDHVAKQRGIRPWTISPRR